jgi:hypothetical protein
MVRPHQLALCQLVSIYIGPSDGHVLPCEAIQVRPPAKFLLELGHHITASTFPKN